MAVGELTQRVAVAAVGIPLAVVLVYAGGWALGGLLAAVAAGSALELYGLAERHDIRPFTTSGAAVAAALVLVGVMLPTPAAAASVQWTLILLLTLGLAVAAIWLRGPEMRPMASVAVSLLGALFCGGTLTYGVFLRELPERFGAGAALEPWASGAWVGTALLGFPVVLTWVNDSCAYFGGRRWGRRKLSPVVSPGKTVEGSVAGLLGTVAAGVLYAGWVLQSWAGVPIGPFAGALGAVVISASAQVGDLAESLFKREAGVKDSARVLPGHGGLLDRFDALFLTVPVGYWFLAAVLMGRVAP